MVRYSRWCNISKGALFGIEQMMRYSELNNKCIGYMRNNALSE